MDPHSNAPIPPTTAAPEPPAGAPDQAGVQPMQQPSAQPAASGGLQPSTSANDTNFMLGVIGLVIGFVIMPLIGFILCLMAYKKSKQAGYNNTVALVGAWVHGVLTALTALAIIFFIVVFTAVSR